MGYFNPTSFKLIFGNRLRLDDEAFQYSDLLNQSISAGTTTKVNSTQWNSWKDTYEDEVSTFITSALDASLNNVVNSTDQDIIIDESGLRGRTTVGGSYSDKQVWLVNNMIAFTDDNWDSAKMAIGEFEAPDGSSVYGIVAEQLQKKTISKVKALSL